MQAKRIVVVGGGPAGMMAAIRAGQLNQEVTLVEKNPVLGKKLLLSGKGRSNLTNSSDLDSHLARFSRNGEFLRDAFKKFFNRDLMDFFQQRGLELKIERQQRVFPVTDRANSVLKILEKELQRNKVKIIYKTALKDIVIQENRIKGLLLDSAKFIPADKIILATGGVSYGFTGSTGEGIELARKLGHTVIPLSPGLVPLETRQRYPLEGLTLKNIRLKFGDGKTEIDSGIGELLFTGFGISGPLVLSLSGRIADWLNKGKRVFVEIDLKPALSREQLNARLLREFESSPKKTLKNVLKNLLPLRLMDCFIKIADIGPEKKISQVTKQERQKLIALFKALRFDILKPRPIEEA
ncbi:MAG: hypothetical protein A3K83_04815, partial [Omnitrophica WOR_2 bacterium RBG_13_44_8b]